MTEVRKPLKPVDAFILYLKGIAMGAADVVPGVSGGTIAFITGIYHRLLLCIESFSLKLFGLLKKDGIPAVWKEIDGNFLVVLFAGIGTSIVFLSHAMTWAMQNTPVLLWSFFFGLILVSSWVVGKQAGRWKAPEITGLVVCAIGSYGITLLSPGEMDIDFQSDWWIIFLAGSVALCAMILPGISGSFILLLMGLYTHLLSAIKGLDGMFLLVFFSGGAIGLMSFSRLLDYLLTNWRSQTLASLTGVMLGSLNKAWPWKETLSTRINSKGLEVPVEQVSILPGAYAQSGQDAFLVPALSLMLLGAVIAFLLGKVGEAYE